MKIFNRFIFLLVIFHIIHCIEKVNNTQDALKKYPHQDRKNGKRPKFIYFTMKKNLPRDLDYYSKIFYHFMSTVGVRPYFVNLNDSQLLGIVSYEAEIDTEPIKENFEDLVENIQIKDKMDS